jgi:hypothetical protein
MKAPWIMKDYNKKASKDYGTKFRPVDIFDAKGKLLFRISDGEYGVKVATKIVACINLVSTVSEGL